METQVNTTLSKASLENFAKSVMQECKKFYAPTENMTVKKSDAAINVVCLRAIQFRKQYGFGILGIIKTVKIIRAAGKHLQYSSAFMNELSISLVLALMRMNQQERT